MLPELGHGGQARWVAESTGDGETISVHLPAYYAQEVDAIVDAVAEDSKPKPPEPPVSKELAEAQDAYTNGKTPEIRENARKKIAALKTAASGP